MALMRKMPVLVTVKVGFTEGLGVAALDRPERKGVKEERKCDKRTV